MQPDPAPAAQQHSARLRARINAQIAAHGWLAFDAFMDAALYAPQLGYYHSAMPLESTADATVTSGDFITAPQMGDVFARCIARQCAAVLDEMGDVGGDVLEFGAGSGQLVADVLTAMHAAGCAPARYFILETSAAMRDRQRRTLNQCAHAKCVQWLDALPDNFRGVMLANEVLDAMPALRFEIAGGEAHALGVGVTDDGNDNAAQFCWTRGAPLPETLQQRLAEYNLPDGYRSEIGLRAEAWVRTVGEKIHTGALLVIDYGFPRHEFYHPDRSNGTLMCHYRHHAHDDPFFYPGLQDISVHVDFTAVSEAAREVGMRVAGFTSQGAFLLALDALGELNAGEVDARQSLNLSRQIQTLTMPHEMGELFKVIAVTRNYPPPLRGFSLTDRRARL